MEKVLTGAIAFAAGAYVYHCMKEHDMMILDKRDMRKIKRMVNRMMW